MMRKLLLGLFTSFAVIACTHNIPQEAEPIAMPDAWLYAEAKPAQWPSKDWWQQFQSEELLFLQTLAQENNPALAAMAARLLQADYQLKIMGASNFPQADVSLGARHRARISGGDESQLFNADVAASYEVDVWGRLSAERRAAHWQWQGTRYDQQALMLSVSAGVGLRYINSLALQEKLRIAQLQLETAEEVLRVVEARVNAGAVSPMDLMRQSTQVARQRAALHPLEQSLFTEYLELATLLGVSAKELALKGDFKTLHEPQTQIGFPSELLLRRPDLQQEETKLRVAEANVEAARAALFPAVRLTASTGQTGDTWAELWRGSWLYNIGASVTQPIFQGGKLKAAHQLSQAQQVELLEAYRGVLLTAFTEVEVALRQ